MVDVSLRERLQEKANPEKAKVLQRFFKTGPGQYGEGDVFLGVMVPETRKVAKEFIDLEFSEIEESLRSKIHEERQAALLILVERFRIGNGKERKKIYDFYLKNAKKVNNWDLVDLSADKIVGGYLLDKDRGVLYGLAKSDNLWERRISIISCFAFIRKGEFNDCLGISDILLNDGHDLIQKAVGWMLREVGNRDRKSEEKFLQGSGKRYKRMPRTMLRYAIEKFPEDLRKRYLRGEI
jgi:3-methyladenine DNA glycosylase AlkD